MLLRRSGVKAALGRRGPVVLGFVAVSTAAALIVSPSGAAADPTIPPILPLPPILLPTSAPSSSTPPPPAPDPTDPTPTGSTPVPSSSVPAPTTTPPTGTTGTSTPPGSGPASPSSPSSPATPTPPDPGQSPGDSRGTAAADPVINAHPAAVTMASFDATTFVFRGTKLVRTPSGQLKVLWFQAARAKAADYRLKSTSPGPGLSLNGDMDLTNADVYATRFSGTLAVPALGVPLAPVTLTPDLVPAWLTVDLTLPAFSAQDVTLEQAFIRAEHLTGNGLSVS